MKFLTTDLIADTTAVYDKTKTTLYGRAQLKTADSDIALGPPLNRFVDVFTDLAIAPSPQGTYLTKNGRLFHISAIVAGIATLTLHTIDLVTGATAVIGKVALTFPNVAATTHVIRSLKVYDPSPSTMKVLIETTASVVTNGGLFVVNKVDVSDFSMVTSVTFPMATSADQKAVYFYQQTGAMGSQNLMTSATGLVLDYDAAIAYFHNGVSATHQYYKFDLSVAPTVDATTTNVSISGGSPATIITPTTHTFISGNRIVFTVGTLPTGLLLNTVYFVVAPITVTSFSVSATVGGAAINTAAISAFTITLMRAFGESDSGFLLKTGNLPTLSGNLLNSDSEDFAVPQHGPVSTLGQDCAFMCTSTFMYLGKLSDLTSGSTAWSSLSLVNVLGVVNEITTPTPVTATWSNALDSAIYATTGSIFIIKKFVNNQFISKFGGTNTRYLETLANPEVVELQLLTINGLDVENGILCVTGGTIGQRGTYISDIRSDAIFGYSHAITKVISTKGGAAKFISTLDKLFDYTGGLLVNYRTSGFDADTGGWNPMDFASDLSSINIADEIQFDIYWSTLGLDTSIPAQLTEFIFGYDPLNEMSSKWRGSVENSSKEGDTPFYSAFRMVISDSGKKFFRAYDDSNVLVNSANTEDDFADFDYSTDNGSTWTQLPSANAYPATVLTTELRYKWLTSPSVGTKLTVSLRDL
jgi:hypothetical protein